MTTDAGFDPNAPLPGPPDPWASTDTPVRRSGPPYHMTDMIAAEPAVARRILASQAGAESQAAALATAIATAARAGRAIVVTGCGTSEHAALGVVEILREAARAAGLPGPGPVAAQAFELSLDPPGDALVIGVSHEGGTAATNAALTAARDAGSQTALLTVSRRSPGGALADLVVETHELDQGWCHIVGYTSPMLAAAAVGAHLSGRPLDGDEVAQVLAGGSGDETGAERIAGRFADAEHLIVIASGADRPSGREMTLKVEEASWLPSRVPRPRDVPARPPARDGAGDGARPDPRRSRPPRRTCRPSRRRPAGGSCRRHPGGGHPDGRPRCDHPGRPDPGRPDPRPRGAVATGADCRAVRDGHRTPARDRARGPRARHRPGPDPAGRPALQGRFGRRRRLIGPSGLPGPGATARARPDRPGSRP